MKKILIATILIICSYASVARADLSSEKRAEIQKMLRLTGMESRMGQMKSQIIAGMRKQMSDMSDVFWTKLEQKLDYHELIEMVMPIYDKYYTLEDLKSANAFYESPAGIRILSVSPMVSQEVVKISMEWGAKIGKQAEAEAEQQQNK